MQFRICGFLTRAQSPPECRPSGALARSYRFVAGDRPERFDKAWASNADQIIIDLESTVAPVSKEQARHLVASWLDPRRPVWLRVNAVDAAWFDGDLRLACEPGLAGSVLPKAEAVPIALLNLSQQERIGGAVALIETAEGLCSVREIGATPGVGRLAFGAPDFQVDLDIEGDGEELLFFRSQRVWQSRLAELPAPIDGAATAIDGEALVRAQAVHSHRLGFELCIDPRQWAPVHETFTPGAARRAGRHVCWQPSKPPAGPPWRWAASCSIGRCGSRRSAQPTRRLAARQRAFRRPVNGRGSGTPAAWLPKGWTCVPF